MGWEASFSWFGRELGEMVRCDSGSWEGVVQSESSADVPSISVSGKGRSFFSLIVWLKVAGVNCKGVSA